MLKKEAIIRYIKEMNTDMLSLILDDDISYMETTKKVFLDKLNTIFSDFKLKGVLEFSQVCKGKCIGDCENNGQCGYRFSHKEIGYLDLIFKERNKENFEICRCSVFKSDDDSEIGNSIHITIYDDEKTSFWPTFEQINLINRIASLQTKYNVFKNQVTPITEVYPIIKESKQIYESLTWDDQLNYEFANQANKLYTSNSFVIDLIERNDIAIAAMEEYSKIDVKDEKSIIKWLLKHDDNYFISDFEKMENWEYSHYLTPEYMDAIVIDCTDYTAGIVLYETFVKHYHEVMWKYRPTEEHEKIAGKHPIILSLPSLLTWHMKYQDLLPDNIKIVQDEFEWPS
ncbi:hypothetical protein [Flavicella marina]|uniref:hypothetical protein n=1 Tax=Flavicella marina TaxID=1475951 RepID=UPI001264B2DC|nr:hypothetical protein [Flavicella marina]